MPKHKKKRPSESMPPKFRKVKGLQGQARKADPGTRKMRAISRGVREARAKELGRTYSPTKKPKRGRNR